MCNQIMLPNLLFSAFLLLSSCLFRIGISQKCPRPPPCPTISPPPRPTRTVSYVRPRQPLYNLQLRLLPQQPNNNPGPLANQARILAITQELKRNITFDPQNYTGTWVGNNYCLFKGFVCDTVPDLNITGLAGIDFNGATFSGNLNFYRFVTNLPDIAIFHANSNNFSGIIGQGLSGLRYFYEIDLSNNKFIGGFPSNVLSARNLTFIDLRFNNYLGTVPRSVFNFDTDVLFINNNVFSQSVPTNLGNTPALYLTLANNNFTGTIPRSIGAAWETMTEVNRYDPAVVRMHGEVTAAQHCSQPLLRCDTGGSLPASECIQFHAVQQLFHPSRPTMSEADQAKEAERKQELYNGASISKIGSRLFEFLFESSELCSGKHFQYHPMSTAGGVDENPNPFPRRRRAAGSEKL
ncbi:Leucine-rich repeat family protein [Hibiscus syriacus]|uniref:Leucine-rich repeat family protein n=1 Tax=Hibiscus syriacus TaxID=106335 RepID=A0A6A2XB93_HIBSY|nr:Leucine-rich repeat family protein [Hibiscus syriacus]